MVHGEVGVVGHRERRRHSISEKRRIVEQTFAPGASVAQVALANGVNANQVFTWRRAFKRGELVEHGGDSRALLPVVMSKGDAMKGRAPLWFGGSLLFVLLFWGAWYFEAGNFSISAVSGTYVLHASEATSTLVLRSDHSFQQELNYAGETRHAQGTWRPFGEGHIAFSSEYLHIPAQRIGKDGTVYAQIENCFGFVSIDIGQNSELPKFHKRWFH